MDRYRLHLVFLVFSNFMHLSLVYRLFVNKKRSPCVGAATLFGTSLEKNLLLLKYLMSNNVLMIDVESFRVLVL